MREDELGTGQRGKAVATAAAVVVVVAGSLFKSVELGQEALGHSLATLRRRLLRGVRVQARRHWQSNQAAARVSEGTKAIRAKSRRGKTDYRNGRDLCSPGPRAGRSSRYVQHTATRLRGCPRKRPETGKIIIEQRMAATLGLGVRPVSKPPNRAPRCRWTHESLYHGRDGDDGSCGGCVCVVCKMRVAVHLPRYGVRRLLGVVSSASSRRHVEGSAMALSTGHGESNGWRRRLGR